MLRNRLTLSLVAIIGALSVNARADTIGYIPNKAGNYIFITDGACVPKEAVGLTVAAADANGYISSETYGCIQKVDDLRYAINWNSGGQSIIIAAGVTWTAEAKLPWATPVIEQPAEPAIETKQWMARNPWFGTKEFEQTTLQARAIDKQVFADGYRIGDGKYFDEIDRRLNAAGIKFTPTKPGLFDDVLTPATPNVDWSQYTPVSKPKGGTYDHSKTMLENYSK